MIQVEQGKGRKDRYTILSKRFLSELEIYWREYRPEKHFFFGADEVVIQNRHFQARKNAEQLRNP